MANAERIGQLLAWARGRSSQINAKVAAAKDADEVREALGEANTFLHALQEERKELAAELGEVRQRLAAGRPPRQHRTTWARVEADLLADAAHYEQGLATLSQHIREQEQLEKSVRSALVRPARSAKPATLAVSQRPDTDRVRPAVGRSLRRLALWAGGGLVGLLVLSGLIMSGTGSKPQPSPQATEAADLWTRAPELVEVTRMVEVTRIIEQTVAPVTNSATVTSASDPLMPTEAPPPTDTPEPTNTPPPTDTPVPTPTPAPAAAKAANVRGGPGTNYPIVGGLKAGQALAIAERTSRGDWYRLASGGWLAASLVANAPANVPVAVTIPPTPVPPTPVPPPTATPVPVRVVTVPTSAPQPSFSGCCKVCTNSKACGDSCISWGKTCRKGPGCACQG